MLYTFGSILSARERHTRLGVGDDVVGVYHTVQYTELVIDFLKFNLCFLATVKHIPIRSIFQCFGMQLQIVNPVEMSTI